MTKYAAELAKVYGAFPARLSLQGARIAELQTQFPGVDWQPFIDDVGHADNPNHESGMPNFQKASDRYTTFYGLYKSTPNLDLEAELAKMITDLQAIFDQMK
jgi:multiple sugar transport system substrate-binding protein